MSRWLSKVSFVATDYRSLVNVLTSASLSAYFGDHVPIHHIPGSLTSAVHDTELTVDTIKDTLSAFGYPQTSVIYDNSSVLTRFEQYVLKVAESSNRSAGMHQLRCPTFAN